MNLAAHDNPRLSAGKGAAIEEGAGVAACSAWTYHHIGLFSTSCAFSTIYLLDERPVTNPSQADSRRNNQPEKVIRTLRQQRNRFFEINPEQYALLKEDER
jgi:hypothetical protein